MQEFVYPYTIDQCTYDWRPRYRLWGLYKKGTVPCIKEALDGLGDVQMVLCQGIIPSYQPITCLIELSRFPLCLIG